jgi:hypothetical protein
MRAIPVSCPNRALIAFRFSILAALTSALIFCDLAVAQETAQAAGANPRPLIRQRVEESQVTILKGNTHPLARDEFDLGGAPASLPMDRMLLVLKRSPEQENALRKLLDDQQDKASPNYHKWLTPQKYGQQFGPSDFDLQTITGWLQSHGFQVSSTKGRTVLEFSGSASQIQEAFHTSIHKYIVNGEQHWANSGDPQIPSALAPAVAGISTLHNFLKKPQIHVSSERGTVTVVPGRKPLVTFPSKNGPSTNTLGPADYATIYNINPTYNSNINGQGVTIGIVGRSNLFNGGQDVSDFRFSVFGIFGGPFSIILNGPDPGDLGGGEEAEATLDTTWAGAIAPNATVNLVVSATTNTTDGIDLSELYIVENNFADVMTESFGTCELAATDAQVAFTKGLAEQAAAEGITYFVSTGDSGAAGCDDPNAPSASYPASANLLASTPFSVAVGGTMFNENSQDSKYWGSGPPVQETALSYIPENVWNESCSSATCGSNANLSAGSGGASSGNIANGGTFAGFTKPAWQSGVTGIPADRVRDLPDISLTSASHDPYLLCLQGSCSQNFIYFVWGTSAAAPSFAGIMALVDQQMSTLNGPQFRRQGQANYVLYRLAASQIANGWLCNGSNTTNVPDITNCIFNDTTVGNNAVPGELNYGLANAQYQAGAGYDLATGLGSVNVTNLVNQWNSVTFNPTATSLTLNNGSSVNVPHGSPVTVAISVTASSGSRQPTGDVALIANVGSTYTFQTAVDAHSLVSGQAAFSTAQLPGGTYTATAHYAGDATFAPSDSASASVTVTPEPSTTTLSVLSVDSLGHQTNFTDGPFGSFVYLRADVAGVSGSGVPTGGVTFLDGGSPIVEGSLLLNSEGNTATPNGIVNFDTGTHTVSASYSGDASFNSSNSTQSQSFSITPGFYATLAGQTTVVIPAPGSSGQSSVAVSTSTGFSGTISLACSGLPSEATCTFSPSSIPATGTPAATSASILIATKAATAMLSPLRRSHVLAQWLIGMGFLLSIISTGRRPQRRRISLLLLTLALILVVPGCGGGGGSSKAPPPDPGTPTGFSTVVVTASSGSTVSRTSFTLIVQ